MCWEGYLMLIWIKDNSSMFRAFSEICENSVPAPRQNFLDKFLQNSSHQCKRHIFLSIKHSSKNTWVEHLHAVENIKSLYT